MKIFVEGNMLPAVTRMFPIWQKYGYVVVNNPNEADAQMSIVKIRIDSGLPTLLRLDGVYYEKEIPWKEYNIPISESHTKADAVVYQSYTSKRFCEQYLEPKNGICDVIYNGMNPNEWNDPIEHNGINIVSCASWRRWKRLPEIINVFKKFKEKNKNSMLHIVGNMGRGAEEIICDGVKYYGLMDHENMKKLYRSMDVYLHLAKNDSCPSTMIEAIAAGIPVITTDACGGATEICGFTKGCHVINGDIMSHRVESIYGEEWNKLSNDIQNEIVIIIDEAIKNRSQLHFWNNINYTAMKYIDLIESIV